MSLSSGTRSLLSEALSWVAVTGLAVAVIVNYNDLKALIEAGLGLPPIEELAAATDEGVQSDRPSSHGGSAVELQAGQNGHFHTDAEINGRGVEVMVDTGASIVALTWEDAERAGIFVRDRDFTHRVSTANGVARVAPVTLDRISIGDITVRNVQGVVSERGALSVTLLGMSFLSRLERVDMRSGTLILED